MKMSEITADLKLICMGDSLTFGYGVRPSQRWTNVAAQKSGWEIVNEGINGDTTGGMLVRLRTMLLERDKHAPRPRVLLMGGGNDVFFSGTDVCARANMGAIVNYLLSAGIHTIVGIPTPICAEAAPPRWAAAVDFFNAAQQMEQYCEWLRNFSEVFEVECVDFRADFMTPDGAVRESLLLDGLHPTPEGHRLMAERLCVWLGK